MNIFEMTDNLKELFDISNCLEIFARYFNRIQMH